MLILLALAAPASFADAVHHRLEGTKMHLVSWWSDDLDGDKVPEAIAEICSDDAGVYLVQHGNELLEAPVEIDGRNNCDVPETPPPWRVEHEGVIRDNIAVHHGTIEYAYGIRDTKLVLVEQASHSFEVSRDGEDDEHDWLDYDRLRWSHDEQRSRGRVVKTSGPLVLVTDTVRRPTTIIGGTTFAATQVGDDIIAHIDADRPLVLRDCTDTPCKTTKVARGHHDVPVTGNELKVGAVRVHFDRVEGDLGYPLPPKPW